MQQKIETCVETVKSSSVKEKTEKGIERFNTYIVDYRDIWGGFGELQWNKPTPEYSRKVGNEIKGKIGLPKNSEEPGFYSRVVQTISLTAVDHTEPYDAPRTHERGVLTGYLDSREDYNDWLVYMERAMETSPTLQKTQSKLDEFNSIIADHVKNRGNVVRGGSVEEFAKIVKYKGKVGYHKRAVGSMTGQDFISTTMSPKVAVEFADWGENDNSKGGVIFEFDTTDMSDDEIAPNRYNLKGKAIAPKNVGKKEIVWCSEKFGGYYTPCYVDQQEIHFKKGSKPKIVKVTIVPNYNTVSDESKEYVRELARRLSKIQGSDVEVVDMGHSLKDKPEYYGAKWYR